MSVDASLSLLFHAARVSPALHDAVVEVQDYIDQLRRVLLDIHETVGDPDLVRVTAEVLGIDGSRDV